MARPTSSYGTSRSPSKATPTRKLRDKSDDAAIDARMTKIEEKLAEVRAELTKRGMELGLDESNAARCNDAHLIYLTNFKFTLKKDEVTNLRINTEFQAIEKLPARELQRMCEELRMGKPKTSPTPYFGLAASPTSDGKKI